MSKKDEDRIAARVTASIELRKHTDLAKHLNWRQQVFNVVPTGTTIGPLTDEQMFILLSMRMGSLADAVCGGLDRGSNYAALLKVAALAKIWLENMERDMRLL